MFCENAIWNIARLLPSRPGAVITSGSKIYLNHACAFFFLYRSLRPRLSINRPPIKNYRLLKKKQLTDSRPWLVDTNLSWNKKQLKHLRGQGYDGASSMGGQFQSWASILSEIFPQGTKTMSLNKFRQTR